MRGDGRSPNLLTTVGSATQRYDVLPYKGNQEYLIRGAAAGQNYQLPDATREPFIPNKKTVEKVIYNQSSEFIGICAYGSTTIIHRIPPRGTGRYLLATKATPAGTWYTWLDNCESCGGNKVVYGGFEVRATSAGTNAGGYHLVSGAAALSRSTDFNDRAIAATLGFTQSWWYGECGTTPGGFAVVRFGGTTTPAGYTLNDGPYSYAARFSLDTLPTVAEDYIAQAGFSFDANNYMRLALARTNPIPGNYYLLVAVGGVPLAIDSGVVAAARTPTRMILEKARAGDRSDLWINGVWCCTTAGNPGAAVNGGWNLVVSGVQTGGVLATRGMAASMHRLIHAPVNGVL